MNKFGSSLLAMLKEVQLLLCMVQFKPWNTVVAPLQLFIFLRPCCALDNKSKS